MIYFLVEGYYHTRSRKKYFQRLLIFGAVSEVPFCLAFTENGVIAFAGLDMILTLALCYLMIRVYQNVRNRSLQMLLYLIILVASYWCDWALWAPVLTLAFVYTRSSEKKLKETWLLAAMFFGAENYFGSAGSMSASAAAVSSVLGMTAFGMAGVCILHLYNGKRSENHRKFNKWFFYVFYPVHLTVIGVLGLR